MSDDIVRIAQIISAISAILWPLIAIAALWYVPRVLMRLVERKGVSLKIAGLEITTEHALKSYGTDIADLQEKLADLEDRLRRVAAPSGAPDKAASEGVPISVLWVDDFPNNNAFIVERLNNEGDRIDLAMTTDQGLGFASQRKYDAVISDLGRREPGGENPLAGLDLVRRLRAAGIETPVMIYASQWAVAIRDELVAAGAQEVTSSPVDVFAFLDRVRGGAKVN